MTEEAAHRRSPEPPQGGQPSAETAGPNAETAGPNAETAGPDPAPSISTASPPDPDGSDEPPAVPPGSGSGGPPPGWSYDQPAPPPAGAGFTSRYGLVRPHQGRYLAGVCAAIGRATSTDPVLWRVLLAVLGFLGGIGILVYVAAWLIIPAEGDTASPMESMLGRGRSSMSPTTVIILSVLVAVLFGFIVTDAFRAVVLGVAILIAGAVLINRQSAQVAAGPPGGAAPTGPPPSWPGGTGPGQAAGPAAGWGFGPPPAAHGPAPAFVPGAGYPMPPYPPAGYPYPSPPGPMVGPPVTFAGGYPDPAGPLDRTGAAEPAVSLTKPPTAPARSASGALSQPGLGYPPPGSSGGEWYPSPVGTGYRPAFAPHGPYARSDRYQSPPPPPPPVQPVKRPRERSSLGAATFSMIFIAIGVVAILDLLNLITVTPSTYFAAILVTIALGLLVGAWFGRARWLIALGLPAVIALGISTIAESQLTNSAFGKTVIWAPSSSQAMAERYSNPFGDALLDLRQVDFTGLDVEVTVQVDFGSVEVIVPPIVDVTTTARINAGDAQIFDTAWSGVDLPHREVTDLGPDGPGGGKLLLHINVNAGKAEVHR